MPQLITAASAIRISRICRNNPLPIIFRFRDDISSWLLYILLLKFYFAGPGGEIGLSALLPKRPTSLSLFPPKIKHRFWGPCLRGPLWAEKNVQNLDYEGNCAKRERENQRKLFFDRCVEISRTDAGWPLGWRDGVPGGTATVRAVPVQPP